MIELQEVTVSYGRTVAIDRLSTVISAGITGLFGQNGSGKTTLLRTLAGLIKPVHGTVIVAGKQLDPKDEEFHRGLGYAGHDAGMYPHLSLRENLLLFMKLCGAHPDAPDRMMDILGLTDQRDVAVGALSAGMKRRAAVARALLHEPDILFLDEPYANLDDDAAELVSNAVKAWSRPDRTALVATHGAKKVKAYATAGIILQRGRIVTQGTYARSEQR